MISPAAPIVKVPVVAVIVTFAPTPVAEIAADCVSPVAPVKVAPPAEVIAPPTVKLPVSALRVTAPDPPDVEANVPTKLIVPLLILTEPAPFTFTAPFKVVVPLPVVCTTLFAVIAPAVTLLAELIVIAPKRVVAPTAPVKTTLPAVPAVNPRVCTPAAVPLSVSTKVIVPPAGVPLVVSTNTLPVSVVADL